MQKIIEIPNKCPACGGDVELVNSQLFCINPDCSAKTSGNIKHYIKTVGIKGLGEKTLEKLGIESIPELYELTEQDIAELIGSEKLAEKIYQQITASMSVSLEKFIAALGVPLIGSTAAKKLVPHLEFIGDITQETCKLAGLGDKATSNLVNYINSSSYLELENSLPWIIDLSGSLNQVATEGGKSVINPKGNVCITGKLQSYKTKAEATKILEDKGYIVMNTVNESTHYLVDEAGDNSSKRKKADRLGVTIIDNLIKFLEE